MPSGRFVQPGKTSIRHLDPKNWCMTRIWSASFHAAQALRLPVANPQQRSSVRRK
jgi:hypothetical protein